MGNLTVLFFLMPVSSLQFILFMGNDTSGKEVLAVHVAINACLVG